MRKKNILLIVPPYLLGGPKGKGGKLRSFKAFPYGVLSIATYLKKTAGKEVDVYVMDCNLDTTGDYLEAVRHKISEFKPDVVGVSMMFDSSYEHVQVVCNEVKKCNKEILVVLGGAAATSSYKVILEEQDAVDGVCFSEGEAPFLRLVNSEDVENLLEADVSWVTRKSLCSGKIPQPSFVENLDDLVNIDYSVVDVSSYGMQESFSPYAGTRGVGKQFFLITSRGCPFKCMFCMRSSDNDKSMRYASVREIVKHVESLVANYGMSVLTIYDDQLLFNAKRAKQIFKELARFNLRIECPNGLSVAYIDDEMAMLMRKAGMDTAYLAIESGSPYVLNQIIHKPLTIEKVKPVVQNLRKYGFWIQGYFVTGLPGEKDEHRDETVKFIKDVELDWSGFSLATPSRGSELYKVCIENGYIKKNTGIGEIDPTKYIITTPDYAPEYVARKSYLMNLDVNFVNNHRMVNGDYKTAADCFSNVIAGYPGHAFAYYYLSRVLCALNESKRAEQALDEARKICERDSDWKAYFDFFGIQLRQARE